MVPNRRFLFILLRFGLDEPHGHADDPTYDIRLARIREPPNLAFRFRVRHCVQVATHDLAPATDEFPAKLEEEDRPVVFILPFGLHYLPLILVDLHDGTGPDDREHGTVRQSDKSVHAVAQIHVLEQANRNLAPDLAELRED